MPTYNKLVRDKIPEIIEKEGKTYKTVILDDDQFKLELRKKLKEEVQEYLNQPLF
jgi:predicted house-cleaning noncanonical NTP pyrophosphatase (MazG superfamily)